MEKMAQMLLDHLPELCCGYSRAQVARLANYEVVWLRPNDFGDEAFTETGCPSTNETGHRR